MFWKNTMSCRNKSCLFVCKRILLIDLTHILVVPEKADTLRNVSYLLLH